MRHFLRLSSPESAILELFEQKFIGAPNFKVNPAIKI